MKKEKIKLNQIYNNNIILNINYKGELNIY